MKQGDTVYVRMRFVRRDVRSGATLSAVEVYNSVTNNQFWVDSADIFPESEITITPEIVKVGDVVTDGARYGEVTVIDDEGYAIMKTAYPALGGVGGRFVCEIATLKKVRT